MKIIRQLSWLGPVILILLILFPVSREYFSKHNQGSDDKAPILVNPSAGSADRKTDVVSVNSDPVPNVSLINDVALPNGTLNDLMARGMPLIPEARKKLQARLSSQTTAEVVRDLGNMLSTTINSYEWGGADCLEFSEIDKWAKLIPGNMQVLRLIEEGKQNPSEISSLMLQELHETLNEYGQAHDQCLTAKARLRTGGKPIAEVASETDPYYTTNGKYKTPLLELQRVHMQAYAIFYVMSNLGNFGDGEEFEQWMKRTPIPGFSCREMDAWLAYQFYRSTSISSVRRQAMSGAVSGLDAVWNRSRKESEWRAPWSIHDPMLVAAQIDSSGLKTIDVLEIPKGGAGAPEQIDAILDAFLKEPERSIR